MRYLAIVAVSFTLVGSGETAIVLDSESLRVDDNLIHDHAGILEFQGFRLTSVPPPGNAFRFVSVGTLHVLFPGSTALINRQSNAEDILTAIDGGAFSLVSMDLASLPPGATDPAGLTDPGPIDIVFAGTRPGGATVTDMFTVNHVFLALETVTYSGFENVVSVSWFQGPGFNPTEPPLNPTDPTHQFDNIVLGDAVPVPEPSALVAFLIVAIVLKHSAADLPRAHLGTLATATRQCN